MHQRCCSYGDAGTLLSYYMVCKMLWLAHLTFMAYFIPHVCCLHQQVTCLCQNRHIWCVEMDASRRLSLLSRKIVASYLLKHRMEVVKSACFAVVLLVNRPACICMFYFADSLVAAKCQNLSEIGENLGWVRHRCGRKKGVFVRNRCCLGGDFFFGNVFVRECCQVAEI